MWISKGLLTFLLNQAEIKAYDKGYATGVADNQRDVLRTIEKCPFLSKAYAIELNKTIIIVTKERLHSCYCVSLNKRPYLSEELEYELKK